MRQSLTRIAAFVSWHRRAVGALLAALSVLALAQWFTGPQGPTVPVAVAATEVPAGHELGPGDVTLARVPRETLPDGVLTMPDEAVGKMTAVALARGTPLHANLLATARDTPDGWSIVPIRLPDPALRGLLGPGDAVTLVVTAAEHAEVLSADARIAGVPEPAEHAGLGIAPADPGLVMVEVPDDQAPVVAALGQSGQLSVVLRGG